MTEKLLRSVEAFAKRVMISEWPIFAFVEGPDTDRAFYGRIFEANDGVKGGRYEFILAQDVFLNDVSQGGKQQLLRLFDHFDSRGELRQKTNDGYRNIVFFLDRDFDHMTSEYRENPHLIYTQNMDVEAEILLNGNLDHALMNAYSLDYATLSRIISNPMQSINDLTELWKEWITAAFLAASFGVHANMRHSDTSKINFNTFGTAEQPKVDACMNILKRKILQNNSEDDLIRAKTKISDIYRRNAQNELLKGDWITKYLNYKMRESANAQNITLNVRNGAGSIVVGCLQTLDFQDSWAKRYHFKIQEILNMESESLLRKFGARLKFRFQLRN